MRRARPAKDPGDAGAARWQALRLLERRPQAERELADKLRRRGYEAGVVATVLARLRDTGLVDDAKFAGQFARSRVAAKPVGRRLVAAKLAAHGVERHLAEEAAGAAVAERDERELAAEAVRRYLRRRPFKFAGHRGPDAAKERQRLFGFLMRQGFDAGLIRRVLAGDTETDDLG